jgi:hypothetical protein
MDSAWSFAEYKTRIFKKLVLGKQIGGSTYFCAVTGLLGEGVVYW